VADIFISYTSSDRDWAFWIGQELEKLGHTPRIHEWEIAGGGDIAAWMEERHHNADHILCVISRAYLTKPYSSWERRAAQWAAATDRPNFALPVFVESCEVPTLLAHVKRCDLYEISEDEAGAALKAFLTPATKPSSQTRFPGGKSSVVEAAQYGPIAFPGRPPASVGKTLSNIPITVPRHFLGRDDDLVAITDIFARDKANVAITTLRGMRGVGKTTLAAAYAERHSDDYRATWWVRAQTESTMRADLVGLGVRLGWVAANEKEEPALAAVIERLRHEGEGILLIYDNAPDSAALHDYLPRGGTARVLVTSNSHAWRGVAEPVEIRLWPKEIGAEYLIARTGRTAERPAAEALSNALGGLPLAHEQAAAYCEDLGITLAEYQRRFEAATLAFLDDTTYAPTEYHPEHVAAHRERLTVAGTFRLAIEEAAKRHPAAEPLLVHTALLAPEPIPLFLFAEGREEFGEPLASTLIGDGLDKAVAALRSFALVDRETIVDERNPAITTDCIRLHRLVRQVAATRRQGAAREQMVRALVTALAAVCPRGAFNDPQTWPPVRRLDALALALVDVEAFPLPGCELAATYLLDRLASYRQTALAAYAEARPLFERALLIREKVLGPEHADTAPSINNLALLLRIQGDLAAARSLFERSLAINEKARGQDHPRTASVLDNLASVLRTQDPSNARKLYERALAIREKVLGPEHSDTATTVHNLANLLAEQGDLKGAQSLFERAITNYDRMLGSEHPFTNLARTNLARTLLLESGNESRALTLAQAALAAHDAVFGSNHPWTKASARVTTKALNALGRTAEVAALRERYGITDEPENEKGDLA
jgi:tetratricopeptide (TPR) repeat protein